MTPPAAKGRVPVPHHHHDGRDPLATAGEDAATRSGRLGASCGYSTATPASSASLDFYDRF